MFCLLTALKGCYINLQAEFTLLQDDGDSDDDVIDEDDEVIMEADRVFQNNVGSAGVSPASSGQSLATIFSIDSEVAAFQNRLSFPQWVQPFQVVAPNRHIIYQGQLYWVDGWKWVKVRIYLFTLENGRRVIVGPNLGLSVILYNNYIPRQASLARTACCLSKVRSVKPN